MSIFVGVDPRWEIAERERRDNAMNDILASIQMGRERRDRQALSEAELYFDNPDLFGTGAWEDWVSRNGNRYGNIVAMGDTIAQQRADRESAMAGVIRAALPSRESYDAIPPPLRDEAPDLFGFTGVLASEPAGIQQGTGPLAPEYWPEAQPSSRPSETFLGTNRFAEALGAMSSNRHLLETVPYLAKSGVDLKDLAVNVNPGVLQNLSPDLRSMAVQPGVDQDQFERATRVAADIEMSPEESRLAEERERANQAQETETKRYHDASLSQRQREFATTRSGRISGAYREGSGSGDDSVVRTYSDVFADLDSSGMVASLPKPGVTPDPGDVKKIPAKSAETISRIVSNLEKQYTKGGTPDKLRLSDAYTTTDGIGKMWERAMRASGGNPVEAAQIVEGFYDGAFEVSRARNEAQAKAAYERWQASIARLLPPQR